MLYVYVHLSVAVMHRISISQPPVTPPTNMHMPQDEGPYVEENYMHPGGMHPLPGPLPQHHQFYEDPVLTGTNGYPEIPEQNGLGQPNYREDMMLMQQPMMNVPPNDPNTPPMGGDGMMPLHRQHTGMVEEMYVTDHRPNYTGVGGGAPDLRGAYSQQHMYLPQETSEFPGPHQ